jgi:hypothetical protein
MDLTLPPAIPRRGGPITRAIGRAALTLLGWRIEGEFPNWKVVRRGTASVELGFRRRNFREFALGLDARGSASTLFRGPGAGALQDWGGISIDRRSSNDTVATVVAGFANRERLVLAITPEGTRKAVGTWKSGSGTSRTGRNPHFARGVRWEHRVVRASGHRTARP